MERFSVNQENELSPKSLVAVVLGATGLVGSALVSQLLSDPAYREVITLGRRTSGREHEKLKEHRIDFEQRASWSELVRGDVLFLALGTTRKAAGSQAAQRRVDFDYQYWAADAASQNQVSTLVLVSSAGAHADSRVFYSRMKGELEGAITSLRFDRRTFLRPGILDGRRKEKRSGEAFALGLLRAVPKWDLLSKMRPVSVEIVARAMRAAAKRTSTEETGIWEAPEIFEFEGLDV